MKKEAIARQHGDPSIIVGGFIPREYALTPLAPSDHPQHISPVFHLGSDRQGSGPRCFLLLLLLLLSKQQPFRSYRPFHSFLAEAVRLASECSSELVFVGGHLTMLSGSSVHGSWMGWICQCPDHGRACMVR